MRIPILVLAAATLAAACGGGGDAVLKVQVFQPRGSVQCFGGGSSIEGQRQRLVEGGIEVFSSACGTDGRPYAVMCGLPDGAIGVFEISALQIEAASMLFFAPLASLDSARVVPCN